MVLSSVFEWWDISFYQRSDLLSLEWSSNSGLPPPVAVATLSAESDPSLDWSGLESASDVFGTQYFWSQRSVSQRTCIMLSRAEYPWLSWGRITRRQRAPCPFSALKNLSDCYNKVYEMNIVKREPKTWCGFLLKLIITCIVRVPGLLSSSPWMSKIGFLILSADMNGLIST